MCKCSNIPECVPNLPDTGIHLSWEHKDFLTEVLEALKDWREIKRDDDEDIRLGERLTKICWHSHMSLTSMTEIIQKLNE